MPTADEVYLPDRFLVGTVRRLVTSTALPASDSGIENRVARWPYPKIELTIGYFLDDVEDIEALFLRQNGPERSFLGQSPIERDYTAIAEPLGTATGSAAVYQLSRTFRTGAEAKPVLHPISTGMVIYGNGVALAGAAWSLGSLGEITVTATNGHILTATFTHWIAYRFAEDELETNLPSSAKASLAATRAMPVEEMRATTVIEAFGE